MVASRPEVPVGREEVLLTQAGLGLPNWPCEAVGGHLYQRLQLQQCGRCVHDGIPLGHAVLFISHKIRATRSIRITG